MSSYCFEPGTERKSTNGCFHMLELAPDPAMVRGYEAVCTIRSALHTGSLSGKKQKDLAQWVASQSDPASRATVEHTIALAVKFLEGKPLSKAEEIFKEKYAQQLAQPSALAALNWLHIQHTLGSLELIEVPGVPVVEVLRVKLLSFGAPHHPIQ